jgi:5-carboxymethyl-2-hydroxymuconate isomerase
MPHLVLEYSDNVADDIDADHLLSRLHEALVGGRKSGMSAIKSRVIRHKAYRVGAGQPGNTFVHLSVAVLPGRDDDAKQALAQAQHAVLVESFPRTVVECPHSITVEVRELLGPSYQRLSTIPD